MENEYMYVRYRFLPRTRPEPVRKSERRQSGFGTQNPHGRVRHNWTIGAPARGVPHGTQGGFDELGLLNL